jgi:hypothetical protein
MFFARVFYKSLFTAYCLEFGFEQTFVQKMRAKSVDEIDTRQHLIILQTFFSILKAKLKIIKRFFN